MDNSEIQAVVDRLMERFKQRIVGAIECSKSLPVGNGIDDVANLYMDWLRNVADALRNTNHSVPAILTTNLENTLHSFLKDKCGRELVESRDISSRPARPVDVQGELVNRFKDKNSSARETATQHLLNSFSFKVLVGV